jgi:hypothetical protein
MLFSVLPTTAAKEPTKAFTKVDELNSAKTVDPVKMQYIINHHNVLDHFHMGVRLFIHGKAFIHSFEDKIILGRFVIEARVKLARPDFIPSKTPMKESVYRCLQQGTPNYH